MIFPERLDIFAILLFMSIGQILVTSLFLLLKKRIQSSQNTWLLVAVLFMLGLSVLDSVLIRTRLLSAAPHLLYTSMLFLLLLGPMVYWQFQALRMTKFKWRPVQFLHLIPFILIKIKTIPLIMQSAVEKRSIVNMFYEMEEAGSALKTDFDLLAISFQSHPLVYLVVVLVLSQRELRKKDSRLNRYHIYYFLGLFVIYSFYLFGRSILTFFGNSSTNLYWPVLSILMYVIVCLFTYLIFTSKLLPKNIKRNLNVDNKSDGVYNRLIKMMKEQRPYLSTDVSLNALAQKLDVAPYFLSSVIKELENKNFSDFISHYRIEAVKQLIIDPSMKNYTLEAIGHEAGFSNKMSFNRTFKKYCGMTPSAYKLKAIENGNA